MSARFPVTAIVACALVTAPATANGAASRLVAPPDAPPAGSEQSQANGWNDESEPPTVAPTPTSPPVVAAPPPPSPEVIALREQQRKAERMAIAGYVVTGVGAFVGLLGMPLYISGRIEEDKEENFFQEAGDPEAARVKKRMGGTMMLSGLGIASVGAVLVIVGLVKKKRIERELDASTRPTAMIAPWFGSGGGGLTLRGRF